MVAHSRTALRPHQLRPLNRPTPVAVSCDPAGLPVRVGERGRARRVAAIRDRWRLDDEWWREEPLSRLYYQVECDDGTCETLYCDLLTGAWYRQRESRVR